MVIALPDIGAAVMLYMKDCTELATEVGTRIFLQWPTGQNKLTVPTSEGKFLNCLMIEPGKGGAGYVGSSLIEERVDIKYYGANRLAANTLHKLGTAYLLPPGERIKTSFVKAQCRVLKVATEGVGLPLVDTDASNWPYTMGTYIFTYSGVRVS